MINSRHAFTLVELSIVLVILGLLVGGVLSGQSLIRAAELRAVGREFTQYKTALNAFRDKYFALPGDMPNATKYWGAAAGAGTEATIDATCFSSSTAASIATCNGNGNSQLDYLQEMIQLWKHLANAGLAEGSYSGTYATPNGDAFPGVNVPKSRFPNAAWTTYPPTTAFGSSAFTANYGSLPLFFGAYSEGEVWAYEPVIKAEDAYNIDMKLDDGKPGQGSVIALKNAARPQCVVATNDAYNLASQQNGCTLIFITGY